MGFDRSGKEIIGTSVVGLPEAKPSWAVRGLPYFASAMAFALFCLLGGVVYAYKPYFDFDLDVSHWIQALPWPVGFDTLMRVESFAGDNLWSSTSVVLVVLIVLLAIRARRAAVVLLLVVLVGQGFILGVKEIISRPRPTKELVNVAIHAEEEYSFPSGHTVHYTLFFGFQWFLAWRMTGPRALRWTLLGILGAVVGVIGLCRVYLGAHWVTDVLAGYLLGGALLTTAICGYKWWSAR